MEHKHDYTMINKTPGADGIDDVIFLEGRCKTCKKLLFRVEESISTTYIDPVDVKWCEENKSWLK